MSKPAEGLFTHPMSGLAFLYIFLADGHRHFLGETSMHRYMQN
jgi:hypothetical protein